MEFMSILHFIPAAYPDVYVEAVKVYLLGKIMFYPVT